MVKAIGDGIVIGLRNVRDCRPSEAPRLLSYPGSTKLPATFRDLTPGDGLAIVRGQDDCDCHHNFATHAPYFPE